MQYKKNASWQWNLNPHQGEGGDLQRNLSKLKSPRIKKVFTLAYKHAPKHSCSQTRHSPALAKHVGGQEEGGGSGVAFYF